MRLQSSRTRGAVSALGLLAMIVTVASGCSGATDQEPAKSTGTSASAPQGEAPTEVEADGLPADFPRDEVSVVDGEIVSVQEPTAESGAYNVLIYAGGTPRLTVVEQAVGLLEDAGWSLETTIEGNPPAPQVLTKSGGTARRVIITNSAPGDESAIGYTVQVRE